MRTWKLITAINKAGWSYTGDARCRETGEFVYYIRPKCPAATEEALHTAIAEANIRGLIYRLAITRPLYAPEQRRTILIRQPFH